MEIIGEKCSLRPWRLDDGNDLVSIANDREVWINHTNIFPHPYTTKDAEEWLARCQKTPMSERCMAIQVKGHLAGGAGFFVGKDVHSHTAKIGYWLGKEYWGGGIATEAAQLITEHAFRHEGVARCQADVFGWNPASARVLEKAGYTLEGRLSDGVFKENRYTDLLVYGKLPE